MISNIAAGGSGAQSNGEFFNNRLKAAPVTARVIAAIIDHFFVFVLACLLTVFLWMFVLPFIANLVGITELNQLLSKSLPGNDSLFLICGLPLFAGVISHMMYFTMCEGSKSQTTPGKQMMGLQIIGIHSMRIGYDRAFAKSIMQYVVFYAVNLLVVIPLLLLSPGMGRGMVHRQNGLIVLVLELVLTAIVMCVPFFTSDKQSALDRLLGRMVVRKSDLGEHFWSAHDGLLPEMPAGGWGNAIWRLFYWVFVGAAVLFTAACVPLFHNSGVYGRLFLLCIPIVLKLLWDRANISGSTCLRLCLGPIVVISVSVGLLAALPSEIRRDPVVGVFHGCFDMVKEDVGDFLTQIAPEP